VTLALVDSGGTVIATTVTDSTGAFTFVGVPPGCTHGCGDNPNFVDVMTAEEPNVIAVDVSTGTVLLSHSLTNSRAQLSFRECITNYAISIIFTFSNCFAQCLTSLGEL
jgi:hypothetical protein